MPRGRGGRRRGKAGKPYPQRADLRTQAISAPSGGEYGSRKASEDAQRAIPLPRRSDPALAAPAQAPQGPPPALAGQGDPFAGDSALPDEPVTAGLDVGPGVGSSGLVRQPAPSSIVEMLASLPGASPELKALAKDIEINRVNDEIVLEF